MDLDSLKELGLKLLDYAKLRGVGVIKAIIILIIGFWVARKIQAHMRKVFIRGKIDDSLASFLSSLIGWLVKIAVLLVAMMSVGVNVATFGTIIGASVLAIGLALQGALSNFAGGVLIMLFKPFKLGDLVECQGELGNVKAIYLFNTIFLSPENKTVIVPNGAIMNGNITNYTTEGKIRVDLTIGVAYEANLKASRQAIAAGIAKVPNVLQDPAPTIAVSELADSSVNFAVRPWCDPVHYWDVYFGTLEAVKESLDEAKISIPFPQRDVHIIKEN